VLLSVLSEVTIAPSVPTDYLNFPSAFVRALQLFDETRSLQESAPVAGQKDKGAGLFRIENTFSHRKLDYFIDGNFVACYSS
jgi:hypothetical protein